MKKVAKIRKLHIAVSDELFREIREYDLLQEIDYIFAVLLAEKIETIKRGEQVMTKIEEIQRIIKEYRVSEEWTIDKIKEIRKSLKVPEGTTEKEVETFIINSLERRALAHMRGEQK